MQTRSPKMLQEGTLIIAKGTILVLLKCIKASSCGSTARAMGKWGQSPIYTVSHGPQEIEKSPFRGVRGRGTQNRTPVRGLFWVGGKNVHALRRLKNRPSL